MCTSILQLIPLHTQNGDKLKWGTSSQPVLFCMSAYNVKIKEVASRVSITRVLLGRNVIDCICCVLQYIYHHSKSGMTAFVMCDFTYMVCYTHTAHFELFPSDVCADIPSGADSCTELCQ